jgi:hypothetical protein
VNAKWSQLAKDALKLILTLAALAAAVGVYWLWLIFAYDRPYHRIAREDSESRVLNFSASHMRSLLRTM